VGVKVNMQQPPEHSSRLLGQLAERLRNLHCSLRTEVACVYTGPGGLSLTADHFVCKGARFTGPFLASTTLVASDN
jgi:hypothetical protein